MYYRIPAMLLCVCIAYAIQTIADARAVGHAASHSVAQQQQQQKKKKQQTHQQQQQQLQQQQRTASRADSLRAIRGSKAALGTFHRRFRLYTSEPLPWRHEFFCERTVLPYCFGPRNGGIALGVEGAHSVEHRTMPSMVMPVARNMITSMVRSLLKTMDDAQLVVPGDAWIVGQRVYQRMQHGETEVARDVARACRAEQWWCSALAGYTAHALNKSAEADSAFEEMLRSMSPAERCSWDEVADLLYEDDQRRWYTRLSCSDREQVDRTLWWLADPLYVLPGNERRTEHYYRLVFAKLLKDSNEEQPPKRILRGGPCPLLGFPREETSFPMIPQPNCGPFGRTQRPLFDRELWDHGALLPLMRSLGVPTYLVIELLPLDTNAFPQFLLQYKGQPTYHFMPDLSAVQNPFRAKASSWNPNDPNASERYHPTFGIFLPLEHQVSFFRRGDSARIVAAADVDRAFTLTPDSNQLVTRALFMGREPSAPMRDIRNPLAGTNMVYDVLAPPDSTLMSLEVLVAGVGAARTRFGAAPPTMPDQRVTMSDVMLLSGPEPPVPLLDSVVHRSATHTMLRQGSAVHLFWEIYGAVAGDSITYSLSVLESGRSLPVRLSDGLGITSSGAGQSLGWTEVITRNEAIAGRTISVDLSTLRNGSYTLQLQLGSGSIGAAATVQRNFTVVAEPR